MAKKRSGPLSEPWVPEEIIRDGKPLPKSPMTPDAPPTKKAAPKKAAPKKGMKGGMKGGDAC